MFRHDRGGAPRRSTPRRRSGGAGQLRRLEVVGERQQEDLVPACGAPAAVRHLCAEGMNFAGIAAWCGVDDSTVARVSAAVVGVPRPVCRPELMAMDRAERPGRASRRA